MLARRLNVIFASALEDGDDAAALVAAEMLGVLVGVFGAGAGAEAGTLTGSTGAGGVGTLYEVATGILGSGTGAAAGGALG
jgi:hypothetical protein